MFGRKTIRVSEYEAREAKINALQEENDALHAQVKGYYENTKATNAYFKSIADLLKGMSLGDYSGKIKRDQLQRAYETNAPAFGIINKIANAVGDMFTYLELQQWKGGKWKDVEKHWILDLLRHPNDRYNARRFGIGWAVNRLVYGDVTVYSPQAIGKDRGTGTEMYLIPGHRVAIEKGGYRNPLKGIKVTGTGKSELIEPKDFFMSYTYNLDDTSFYGTSPLVVAALYLSVIDKGMARQDQSLENGGPTALITPKPDNLGVLPQTADSLTEELNGEAVKGQLKALRTAVDVHTLGVSPVDLGILSSHKEAVTALCFIYDIPVDLYYGQSKYENAKEAKKSLYETNAIPLANEFAADLLAHFGLDGEFRMQVNTDKISVLQDDPSDVLDNLNKMHATLNELREAYGYEERPEPWANLPMLPMSTMFGGEGVNDIDENEPEPEE